MLLGGLFAIVVLNMFFMRWFLGKIQSEPLDEPEAEEAREDEIAAPLPEPAIRTSAGVPRSRPLQPVEPPPPGAEIGNPIRLTSLAESSASEPAPAAPLVLPVAPADPVSSTQAPKPSALGAETPAIPAPISVGKLTLPTIAPLGSLTALPPAEPVKTDEPPAAPSLSPLFAAPENTVETSPILPPLNFSKRAPSSERPGAGPIMEQGRAASADLIMTPGAPSEIPKPVPPEPAPAKSPIPLMTPPASPAADLIFVDKPTPALSSISPRPAETSAPAAKDMSPSKDLETSKPAGADLIAIPAAGESPKPAAAESAPTPVGGGLMLIPSSPEASPVVPEPEKSAADSGGSGQSSWKTRLLGRPRIFLPTGGPAGAPAEPAAAKEEPAETANEGSLKEQSAELKTAIVPPKPEDEAPVAKVAAEVPPAADKPAVDEASKEAPVILTPVGDGKPSPKLGEVAESESLVPSKPEMPEPALRQTVIEKAPPSADLVPLREVAPAAQPEAANPARSEVSAAASAPPVKADAPPAKVDAPPAKAPEPKAPEAASPARLEVSAATPAAPAKVDASLAKAAATPNLPASIRPVESVMNQKESTAAVLPSGGRASAQITLGFEITSLQLTPFFKLGAVQLRSLSNIVSLHLIASQAAENPLAAGISFQIETVDLDESSHIKSILLKPLGQSTPTATPQPKLQVENVKLGTGNEGAIEITSSQQTSTAVQMLATFTIAAMDFTPSFEIGSLRLEPNSNTVMLRLAPSSKPTALDLPPSFEVSTVSLEGSAQLATVRLVPTGAK